VFSGNGISLCLEPNVSSPGTQKFFVLKCILFFTLPFQNVCPEKGGYACANSTRKVLYCLPNMSIKLRVRKGGETVQEFWNSQISKNEWECAREIFVFLNPYFFHTNYWRYIYNLTSRLSKFWLSRLVQNGQFLSFPTHTSKCACNCSTIVLVLFICPCQQVWYYCVVSSIIFIPHVIVPHRFQFFMHNYWIQNQTSV